MNTNIKVILLISFVVLVVSGCSLFSSKRKTVPSKNVDTGKTVSKAKYDQLLAKYESMMRTNRDSGTGEFGKGENSGIEADINSANAKAELAETVDVFGKNGIAGRTQSKITIDAIDRPEHSEVKNQIIKLNRASTFIRQNKFNLAMKHLKSLENSNISQISVRAKFLVGELLFKQQEYDLAMQMFEEIIHKYAFSGVVLKALGRLIACSEKLKLEKKQKQYYSILYDFFEAG